MTEKLKPCPFCGGKAMYATYKNFKYIRCRNCNSVSDFYKTIEESENAWNKRPSPWHTGTPTEEGWYLLAVRHEEGIDYYANRWIKIIDYQWMYAMYGEVVAWQKIEPYKEASPKVEHVNALPKEWYDPSVDGLYEKEEASNKPSGKYSFNCSAPNCLDCERNDECNSIGMERLLEASDGE